MTFDSKQLARLIMLADDRIEARELAAYVIGGGCAGRHGGGTGHAVLGTHAKCQRSDASDLWSHQVALERKRAARPEACSQRRPQNIGPGIDPSGPRSSFLVKPSHRVVAQLEGTVTRDVRHAANGQAQLRPRRRMRVEHCAEIKLEIGIAVQHEDIVRPYVIAC